MEEKSEQIECVCINLLVPFMYTYEYYNMYNKYWDNKAEQPSSPPQPQPEQSKETTTTKEQ